MDINVSVNSFYWKCLFLSKQMLSVDCLFCGVPTATGILSMLLNFLNGRFFSAKNIHLAVQKSQTENKVE